jgi:hypothetical protein
MLSSQLGLRLDGGQLRSGWRKILGLFRFGKEKRVGHIDRRFVGILIPLRLDMLRMWSGLWSLLLLLLLLVLLMWRKTVMRKLLVRKDGLSWCGSSWV